MNEFEDDENGESTIWLAFWCNEGLECLLNVSEFIDKSKNELAEKIKTGKDPHISAEKELNSIINSMSFRGRFNPERHYELYTFNANADMTEKTLKEWFDTAPQSAVDWIRKNGNPIIKKTVSTSKPVID